MTRRQEIIDMLSKSEISAQELCHIYKVEMFEILDDLQHIKYSAQHNKKRLVMNPPVCKTCGFTFKERGKVSTPSKCPKCHHERIQAPMFKIMDMVTNKKKEKVEK